MSPDTRRTNCDTDDRWSEIIGALEFLGEVRRTVLCSSVVPAKTSDVSKRMAKLIARDLCSQGRVIYLDLDQLDNWEYGVAELTVEYQRLFMDHERSTFRQKDKERFISIVHAEATRLGHPLFQVKKSA